MSVIKLKTAGKRPSGRGLVWLVPVMVLLGLGIVLLWSSAYTLHETEQGVVVQFGEPVAEVTAAGLHFHLPFIQEVRRFDRRIKAWDGDPNEIPTQGGEFIWVDTTARWRIVAPQRFMESVRDETSARSRLSDVIDSVMRDQIAGTELVEIVRSSDWGMAPDQQQKVQTIQGETTPDDPAGTEAPGDGAEGDAAAGDAAEGDVPEGDAAPGDAAPGDAAPGDAEGADAVADAGAVADEARLALEREELEALTQRVKTGRQALTRAVLTKARVVVEEYGIELVDVQIKRINYVDSVQEQVFRRMVSDQQRRAEEFRSEGQGESARILGEARRELATIRSGAEREAQVIRGEADAEATRIYNEAYAADPSFYAFMRTLQSYTSTIDDKTTLVLGTDSEYYRFLEGTK